MFKERIKTHHSAMSEGKKYMAGMSTVDEVLGNDNCHGRQDATIYAASAICEEALESRKRTTVTLLSRR